MKLKSIKAYGFKSFADKIEIEIKDGITGIVGPNGSGKSNIVDAVKWVLGEQSVKELRGSKAMSDVIFQGSATRKPHTRASVTLTFDNSDHYLNSDLSEIEIKRIVYSSGENEYLLNNAKVRLKDITDLFLDSGAGKEAFSIISQGRVAEILNGRPEDRRAIIEEAAGVLKYKKRKTESLKKLASTNDNLSKIDLIIEELSSNIEPLREQSQKAKKYETFKNELESIEISLLISDITHINDEYVNLKTKADILKSELESLDSSNNTDSSKGEKIKLEILKVESDINAMSQRLLKVTEELSKLEAEKQLIMERKKYSVDDVKLESNILNLKEEILKLENSLVSMEGENANLLEKVEEIRGKRRDLEVDVKKISATLSKYATDLRIKTESMNNIENKIAIMKANIENDTLLPSSIKNLLSNPRLKGIHGTFASKIEIDAQYATAIEVILGAMQNVVITDDEKCATAAINYLKENNLGRVTFFPLNIIKPRTVDEVTLNMVESENGFIGVAADLVNYDLKYSGIAGNLLGNVLVVKSIEDANRIGRIIHYSYRIVSLEGEVLHTGGSLTGGSLKNTKSTLSERNNIKALSQQAEKLNIEIASLNDSIANITREEELLKNNLNNIDAQIISLEETRRNKEVFIQSVREDIENKKSELSGSIGIKKSSLDAELDKTMNTFYEVSREKTSITSALDKLKSHKSDLNTELSEIELLNKKQNSEYNKKTNELSTIEVNLGKMDIKLDNLLLRLNEEYNITYEKAKLDYEIKDDVEADRARVQTLKRSIKELGEVNTGSISEFERVNTRYEFLLTQKNDLKDAIDNLLGIISEMDATMEEEFKSTFDKVNEEFKSVFKRLFKGGTGELILTNPLDLLETGVDIIAEPPGKKLKNITLLSGGEKTLTAIALLFAILNVKVVPFCILDEVEAALDEANVDTFGTYLKEYEQKTQFIVITHKKKTMEYANTLYGITMQESGVSKLVSVKLEGIEK